VLSFYAGGLAPGVYSTSLRVVAGDIKANLLGYKDIAVTFTVLAPTVSGSGTGSTSTSTSSNTPNAAVQAKLTATPPLVALSAMAGETALAESTIEIVADTKAAVAAIVSTQSFDAGGSPWLLSSTATRTASGWTLKILTNSSPDAGRHSANVRLTTLDIDGKVNGSIDVPVTQDVRGRLLMSVASGTPLVGVAGEARSVGTSLYVAAPGLNWSVGIVGGPAGAVVSRPATGIDSGVIELGIDLGNSSPASGNMAVTVTADDGQSTTVNVPYAVAAPSLALSRTEVNVSAINGVDITPLALTMGVNNGADPVATVSSDAAWLKVVRTGTLLSSGFALKADASVGPLASGSHLANVTVSTTTGGVQLTKTLPVKLVLTPATLSTTVSALQFGGSKGRDLSGRKFGVVLSDGLTPPSWTVVSTPAWMSLSRTSGDFKTNASVDAAFTASALPTGLSNGSVVLSTKVNGDTLKATLPVSVQLDAHRLLPAEVGVAFSKVQTWSRLTRQIKVSDNMGLSTPWSASSDQPWLKVTATGKAGEAITLTADTTGLPLDQLQVAKVTVTSTDKTVVAVEPIQVGLWVGSGKLSAITSMPSSQAEFFAVDPIRPYFYATTSNGVDVVTYNVYTGQEVARLKNAVTNATGGLVAADGSRLYLKDGSNTVVIDLVKKVKLATWPVILNTSNSLYARPNGKHMILSGAQAIDAVTGADLGGSSMLARLHCATGAGLSSLICQDEGLSAATIYRGSVDHTLAVTPSFQVAITSALSEGSLGQNGQDLAISPDGTRVATASGYPYVFPVLDADTFAVLSKQGGDAYPNNVEYGSDGRLFAGAATYSGGVDLWVYRPDGTLQASYLIRGGTKNMWLRALKVSGDAMFAIVTTEEGFLKIVPVGP